MKQYLEKDPWKIIEKGFKEEYNQVSESIFSIGNGYMGHRGNFEEKYSGETLQGSYISGIYYPDKTRVGWWKNGYPEYFAKVLNSVNWIGINLYVDGQLIDLNNCKITSFERVLDMKESSFSKKISFEVTDGKEITIDSIRFCSWDRPELGVIEYKVQSKGFAGEITLEPYLDFNVKNQDSNYDEVFWNQEDIVCARPAVKATTKKTAFTIQATMENKCSTDKLGAFHESGYVSEKYSTQLSDGEEVTLHKYVAITSSFHTEENLDSLAQQVLDDAVAEGFDNLYAEQKNAWLNNWRKNDIEIEGDIAAQQGMRFNILQLYQTYNGKDARLNIGPKGFTGEKYGGCTYWDTEAYCLPFYLYTADQQVARNLLEYRYHHLDKAIENAEKLGFNNGAALYPMVTINGEECHNEWEITFEEIHRNGAIAYAIYDYINSTGDEAYLSEFGLEVLIGIARFWAQRFQYSNAKEQYVMLGVTGPNEYENNVNNNWYTNYIAKWCMEYCMTAMDRVNEMDSNRLSEIVSKTKFNKNETAQWEKICANVFLPEDEERNVFLQQEGFLDKDLMPASDIPAEHVPIHQNWSWDRILRSCFIKQADVLQGLYFFEDQFDKETIQRNFNFYEPMTVHESSLSPCIHAILACSIGQYDKAYEMYVRTARLDLDDYNNDTEDGLHITSMAGTWLAIVKGFGGLRIKDGKLSINPVLPQDWDAFSFRVVYNNAVIKIRKTKDEVIVENHSENDINMYINDELKTISHIRENALQGAHEVI